MSQRVAALTQYLLSSFVRSLTGFLYLLVAFVFYLVFFDPRQHTPDPEYFILVLGVFGAAFSFVVTIAIGARANQVTNSPFLARLPSRVEYLLSVLISSLIFSVLVQIALSILAYFSNGPELSLLKVLEIPPLWLAGNVMFCVLALHATDLVSAGWSRVYVFSILALLLYLQPGVELVSNWLAEIIEGIGNSIVGGGFDSLSKPVLTVSSWLSEGGPESISRLLSSVFWPFKSIASGSIRGSFTATEALAPAVIMLYATILFMLAARIFSRKDLLFTE